ncbi:autotransporter outer membrane beta-barrel domain-containing protein [Leminorella grimontii]|uniref:autotransporter outer membrane beta-barrel domain-containing protein n=1 Tax=Leminorella grimontii TaxID=82981 RepID=UPI0032200DD3
MASNKANQCVTSSVTHYSKKRTPVSLAVLAGIALLSVNGAYAANECSGGVAPAAGSTVSCAAGSYSTGIAYSTSDITLNIADGTVTPFVNMNSTGDLFTSIGAGSVINSTAGIIAINTVSSTGTVAVNIIGSTISSQEAQAINTFGVGKTTTSMTDSTLTVAPSVTQKWGIYNHVKDGDALTQIEGSTFNYAYTGTSGGTGGAVTNFLESGSGISSIVSKNNQFNLSLDASVGVVSGLESNTRYATDVIIEDTGSVFSFNAPQGQGRAIFLRPQSGGNGILKLTGTTITGSATDVYGAYVSTTGGNGDASIVANDIDVSLTAAASSTNTRAIGVLASDAGTSYIEINNSALSVNGGKDTRTLQGGVIGRTTDYKPVVEGGNGQAVGNTTMLINNSSIKVQGESGKAIEAITDGQFELAAGSNSTIDASTSVHGSAIFVAGEYISGGLRRLSGDTDIKIGAGVNAIGGWTDDSAPSQINNTATAINLGTAGNSIITNKGTLGAMSDSIVNAQGNRANSTAMASFSLTNAGVMTGSVDLYDTVDGADIQNAGEWNLRSVTDTTGDGVRDTFGVSVSNMGLSGNGTVTNSGTMTLLGDGGLATTLNNSSEYSTGYAANSMAIGGAAQAQLLGVQTFSNSGAINMGNGAVGDVLVISGGQTPGASGNGVFVANGGQITVDTVLNEGGANSASDMLVVDGTRLGSAATGIKVNNLGGQGLQTVDDGIELVRVLDASQSAADVFKLSNRVVAGAYEYDLYQGGVGENADNGNWYLRSQLAPRAETGSYVANMAAASKMFNLRLEDREGRAENSSMWLRQQGNHTESRDTSGHVKTTTNTYVIQGGGEVASVQFGADDRLGLGLMLGYGQSSSKSVNGHSDYSSKGKVDGYSGGVYATWYQDAKTLDGLYVDSWVQYSLLDASVNGEQLASESYDMKGFSASVEGGYRMPVYQGENSRVYVTPQAQVIWNGVKADDHREANGTKVTSDGDNNVQTRLGVKLSRDGVSDMDKGGDKLFTVYTEANWLHNTEQAGATLDGVTTRQAGSTNVGELKVGFEGQLNKHANLWTNVAQQLGDDGYSDTALTVGFKYKF